MGTRMASGLVGALMLVVLAPAQVLSPVSGSSASKDVRQVRIVTLSRHGFEPAQIGVRKGNFAIVVRDLTGSLHAPTQLRQGSKSGAVLDTKQRPAEWKLMEEMAFDLAPGDYFLGVADSRNRSLKITVVEK